MEYLHGKVLCNAILECEDPCSHRVPHVLNKHCDMDCLGKCVPIQVAHNIGGELEYIIKLCSGGHHRVHRPENQHMDDMLEQDDMAYSDLMDELTKPKPEPPKPVHERVKRFLNLEL